jgi:L-arabinokinase
MYGDLETFPVIKDIPLIARKARQSRTAVLTKLGLDPAATKPLILIALRPVDSFGLDLNALGKLHDFTFVSFGLSEAPGSFINLPPDFMPFPDLVCACDVAVSKPGYGIVSEIIANRTPILYIARDDFVEYDILVDGLQRFAVSELLPRENFLAGEWQSYLEQLLNTANDWPDVRVDGAEVAASEILSAF